MTTNAATRGRTRSARSPQRSVVANGADRPAAPPLVSIIVPTYNEIDNIDAALDRIEAAMASGPTGQGYEVVVVDDDSADGTWCRAQERAERDPRVRVLRRVGQRGLSSAVLAGMAMARGQILAVIDADLQHDERRLPDLVAEVLAGADVCLGSREIAGGSYGSLSRRRVVASRSAAALARRTIGIEASDPMSGFFAVSRSRYQDLAGALNPRGFKILLEFLARGPEPRVAEVGYVFGRREAGTTKLSGPVVGAYLLSLIELATARRLRARRSTHSAGRDRG